MNFLPVSADNQTDAITILAEAFADDPVMNWCCNFPDTLVPFFEVTLPPLVEHGLTYLDASQRGAASWLGPDQVLQWPFSIANLMRILKIGGLKGVYRMALSGAATQKHHPKEPHYYLFAIGATPEHRGQGIGTTLISHILRRCDEQGIPAYLENSKEQNLPFYEGHGFKVLRQIRFAASAPPVWLMWREPHTTAQ